MTDNEEERLNLLQQMREVTKAEHAARFSNNPEEYRRLRAEWVALSIRYEKMLCDEVFTKRTNTNEYRMGAEADNSHILTSEPDPFPAMLWTGNFLSDCWRYVRVTAAVSWKLFRRTLGRIAPDEEYRLRLKYWHVLAYVDHMGNGDANDHAFWDNIEVIRKRLEPYDLSSMCDLTTTPGHNCICSGAGIRLRGTNRSGMLEVSFTETTKRPA